MQAETSVARTVKVSVEVWRARVRRARVSVRDLSRVRVSERVEREVWRSREDCCA